MYLDTLPFNLNWILYLLIDAFQVNLVFLHIVGFFFKCFVLKFFLKMLRVAFIFCYIMLIYPCFVIFV